MFSTQEVAAGGGRRLAHSSSSGSSTVLRGRQLQQVQSSSAVGSNMLCSATINYGASVGDASKRGTAEVPIFVGSFDIVVTPQQEVSASHRAQRSV